MGPQKANYMERRGIEPLTSWLQTKVSVMPCTSTWRYSEGNRASAPWFPILESVVCREKLTQKLTQPRGLCYIRGGQWRGGQLAPQPNVSGGPSEGQVAAQERLALWIRVMSLSASRSGSDGRTDTTAAHVPIIPQRPVLPPLRLTVPVESAATTVQAPPVPPVIPFEQRRVDASMDEGPGRQGSPASGRSIHAGQDAVYRRALIQRPLISDRPERTAPETGSPSAADGEQQDAAIERALLAPLLKGTGYSATAPGSGPPSIAPSDGLGDVSVASRRVETEHREFLAESRGTTSSAETVTSVEPASTPYELTAGTTIGATLVNGINSDLPGTVVAQVDRDVYDSRSELSVLVPRGSRLIGRYDDRIVPGQSRVLVAWTRLIFPDGQSVALPGQVATDGQGEAGISGSVNSHLGRVFEDAVLMSVLSAGAELSQPTGSGSVLTAPSVGQTIGAAAGAQLANLGTEMVRQGLTVKPTIIVSPGMRVAVLLADDLVFGAAYHSSRVSAQ